MKVPNGAAKEVHGNTAETEREARVLVALSDTLLPTFIAG